MSLLAQDRPIDQPSSMSRPKRLSFQTSTHVKFGLRLAGAGDDLLEARPVLEVGAADAGVLDDLARRAAAATAAVSSAICESTGSSSSAWWAVETRT